MGHQQTKQAWIVATNMGYGHQRAAYPLRSLAPDGTVLFANNYPGIPRRDYNYWYYGRLSYEFLSRATSVPFIGSAIFGIMDSFQNIKEFVPGTKNTKPTLQLRETYRAIRQGHGKHLISMLNRKNIPLITTFFYRRLHGRGAWF